MKDKFHSTEKWTENYSKDGVLLGAFVDGKLAGFLFAYRNDLDKKSFHVWMCGIDQKYRRQGIMKLLMERAFQHAKNEEYKKVTINTIKEKFPAMYSFITNYGFEEFKKEENKSLFRKKLEIV